MSTTGARVGRGARQDNILCFFVAQSRSCPRGQRCRFSHDVATARNTARGPPGVCWRFYHRGICNTQNSGCIYRHELGPSVDAVAPAPRLRTDMNTRPALAPAPVPRSAQTSLSSTIHSLASSSARLAAAASDYRANSGSVHVGTGTSARPVSTSVATPSTRVASTAFNSPSLFQDAPQRPSAVPVAATVVSHPRVVSVSGRSNPTVPAASTSTSTSATNDTKVDCNICYEEPTIFGLLSDCNHVFCWRCIDEWRKQPQQDTCPVCRRRSMFHVASPKFLSDKVLLERADKARLFDGLRRTWASPAGVHSMYGSTAFMLPPTQPQVHRGLPGANGTFETQTRTPVNIVGLVPPNHIPIRVTETSLLLPNRTVHQTRVSTQPMRHPTLLPLPVTSTNSAPTQRPNRQPSRSAEFIVAILFLSCLLAGSVFLVFEIMDNAEVIEAMIHQVVEFVSQVITIMIFLAFFASFCCR